jgi:hypothetical protein
MGNFCGAYTIAKPSLSVIVKFLSAVESFLLAKAMGWSMSPAPGYAKTAPNEMDEVSTCTLNSLLQSGKTNIGAMTIFFFSVLRLCWNSSVHWNLIYFFNSFSIGVFIYE